ncbi:MAG: rhamnogalacturonan lyase [Opitutales bacterium]|nr:rhamnogalacturonan lyase [Opitutales bacterium]
MQVLEALTPLILFMFYPSLLRRPFVSVITALLALCAGLSAQMQVEALQRGLIAIQQEDGFYLSWRLLGTEPYETAFNVYRDGELLNEEPLSGATIFMDDEGSAESHYTVNAVIDGAEVDASEPARMILNTEGANAGYFDIPLQRPETGPQGGSYSPNDASAGDLNGDGHYEIVLMWEPSNARDNAHRGITDNVLLDAYTLDGELLWRIDLGPNIRAGAHYTQFMVYDFDGNGRSEIMVKTAPGTVDGEGNFIAKGPAADADHSAIYRNRAGYIIEGPEYLTVFDGLSGAELDTAEYFPVRGDVSAWGDSHGNRVDRFNAAVAYLDGERPSAVFQRGYYTRLTMAAWDWRDGKLTCRWTFDSDEPGNESYYGQGNHQLSVADVNNNGRHDIITGPAVIGSDGQGLHNVAETINPDGHGDALHVTQMIKGDPTPYIFMPFEGAGGLALRPGNSAEYLWYFHEGVDHGRGVAAELDPEMPGFHFWGSGEAGSNLFNFNGERVGNSPSSVNHVIWWNGELSRELLNRNTIEQWHIRENRPTRLLTAEGASSINGTKANPNLQADLFGDWREEVIFNLNDTHLRVYTTTMPTEYRLPTLMHDPVYRVAIAWQNSSYNQPPHPGYYIATDMLFPPPPLNVKTPE